MDEAGWFLGLDLWVRGLIDYSQREVEAEGEGGRGRGKASKVWRERE